MFDGRKQNNIYEVKISDDNEQNLENDNNSVPNNLEEPMNQDSAAIKGTECAEENKYIEQLQRLQAEFMNYKKRTERERLELSNLFKSELVSSLLPVIDDFERMLDHSNDEKNEFLKGIKLIYQKFIDVLKGQGLKLIEAKGQRFDPAVHEAVLSENNENDGDEIVVEEWRKGYLLNDRLLRPAQVKVLKSEKVDAS